MSLQARSWTKFWAALVGAAVLAEFSQLRRPECTLSHATRYMFRTHTRGGRVAFIAAWWSLCVWFTAHVIKGANVYMQEVLDD